MTAGKPPTSQVQWLIVDADESGQRLDNYLMARLKGVPKSLIYRVIRKGEVRVNKGRAKPELKLAALDTVRIPPIRTAEPRAIPKPSDQLRDRLHDAILYEGEGLLVINKPSGLAVHGGSGVSLGLIEALRQVRPENRFLELVHRLDRDTSGCIMVATKRSTLKHLQEALRQEGGVKKDYLALVEGRWPKRRHKVNVPLRKNELLSGERIVRVDATGKAARTEFEVVQYYRDVTLLKASPITGRTHQIRVHALHAGHPLVSDEKYGKDEFNKSMKSRGFKRLFLHAQGLQVVLPGGQTLAVEAPLPDDLAHPLKSLEPA